MTDRSEPPRQRLCGTFLLRLRTSEAYPESAVHPDTIMEYEATQFIVNDRLQFRLDLHRPCPELQALYQLCRCQTAAFITAWNPAGQCVTEAENADRQRQLMSYLDDSGVTYFHGYGKGSNPLKNFCDESVLAMGLTEDQARRYGELFDQDAIVWAAQDAVPKLLMLR